MIKKIIFLFFLLLPTVNAIGISPSQITIDNIIVGEEIKHYFFLISPSEGTYLLKSDCKEIHLPQTVTAKDKTKVEFFVKLIEEPSHDLICSIFIEKKKEETGLTVSNAIQLTVNLRTTREKNPSVIVYNIEAIPAEALQEPIVLVGLENDGNVVLNPELEFLLENETRHPFGKLRAGERIQKMFKLAHLPPGRHIVNLSVKERELNLGRKIFEIKVLSATASQGKVVIENVSIDPGKLTKISVRVRNDSPVLVNAKAIIEFYKKDELIGLSESNETQVFDVEELNVYKKLKKGDYKAEVRVVYNQKRTLVHEVEFSVGRQSNITGFVVNQVGDGNLVFLGILFLIVLLVVLKRHFGKIIGFFRKIYGKVFKDGRSKSK
tara:strand:+ start:778 stop:1914 length:1137 start_codon:yes stop_codon:yes gene_type:complete